MEKEEIFVSKFRALVGTVKNRIASSEKGTVAFARFYKSYLLRDIHFRQEQNNFEMKLARLISSSHYVSEPKSDHEIILGNSLLCFSPATSLVLMMSPQQLPRRPTRAGPRPLRGDN